MLLVFRPEATLRGDPLPPHGAQGPGHFALGIAAEDLDGMAAPAARAPGGRWSTRRPGRVAAIPLYFRDPAGNSVELITPGVWGLPSGW